MSREDIEEYTSEDVGFRLLSPRLGLALFDDPVDFSAPEIAAVQLHLLHAGPALFVASNTKRIGVGALDDLTSESESVKFASVPLEHTTCVRLNATSDSVFAVAAGVLYRAPVSAIQAGSADFTRVSSAADIKLFEPLPAHNESYALLDARSTLHIHHNGKTAEVAEITAFAWHGADIVATTAAELKLVSLDGSVQTSYAVPDAGALFAVSAISINDFYVVGLDPEDEEYQIHTLVQRSGLEFTSINLFLPLSTGDAEIAPTPYCSSMLEWSEGTNYSIIAYSLSTEISLVETGTNTRLILQLNDTDRAELPMENYEDTFPVGLTVDLSGINTTVVTPTPAIEEAVGVLPRLLCLNNEGHLLWWHIFDVQGVNNNKVSLERAQKAQIAFYGVPESEGASIIAPKPEAVPLPTHLGDDSVDDELSDESKDTKAGSKTPAFGFSKSGFAKSLSPVKAPSSQSAFSSKKPLEEYNKDTSSQGPTTFGSSSEKSGFGSSGFGSSGFGSSRFGTSGFGSSGFGNPKPSGDVTNVSSALKEKKFGSSSSFGSGSVFGNKLADSPLARLNTSNGSPFGTIGSSKSSPFGSVPNSGGSPFGLASLSIGPAFGSTQSRTESPFDVLQPSNSSLQKGDEKPQNDVLDSKKLAEEPASGSAAKLSEMASGGPETLRQHTSTPGQIDLDQKNFEQKGKKSLPESVGLLSESGSGLQDSLYQSRRDALDSSAKSEDSEEERIIAAKIGDDLAEPENVHSDADESNTSFALNKLSVTESFDQSDSDPVGSGNSKEQHGVVTEKTQSEYSPKLESSLAEPLSSPGQSQAESDDESWASVELDSDNLPLGEESGVDYRAQSEESFIKVPRPTSPVEQPPVPFEGIDIGELLKETHLEKFDGFTESAGLPGDEFKRKMVELLQYAQGHLDILAGNVEKSEYLMEAFAVHRRDLRQSDLSDASLWAMGDLDDLKQLACQPQLSKHDALAAYREEDERLTGLVSELNAFEKKREQLERIVTQIFQFLKSVELNKSSKRPLDVRAEVARQNLRKKLAHTEKLQEEVMRKLVPFGVKFDLASGSSTKITRIQRVIHEIGIKTKEHRDALNRIEAELHSMEETKLLTNHEHGDDALAPTRTSKRIGRAKIAKEFASGGPVREIVFAD